MTRWPLFLSIAVLLAGCAGTPAAPRQREEVLFLNGPEIRAARDFRTAAMEHRSEALQTQDPVEREMFLEEADEACRRAREEYRAAFKIYPYNQHAEIDVEMASVYNLMLVIERERRP